MTCRDVQDALPEFVLGTLPPATADRVRQHLDAPCAECQRERELIEAAFSLVGESASPTAPRGELKDEIWHRLQQGDGDAVGLRGPPPTGGDVWRMTRSKWLAPVAALLAIGLGFGLGVVGLPEAGRDGLLVEFRRQQIAAAEDAFGRPATTLATYALGEPDGEIQAVMFFDRLTGQIHVVVDRLSEPQPPTTLWFWLVRQDETLAAAGPLKPVGRRHLAELQLQGLPRGFAEIRVTAEPEGDHREPTGPVVGRIAFQDQPPQGE